MRLFYFNVRMLVILMMIISLEVPCFLCSSLNSLSFNASHDRALSQNSDWNIELSCLNSRTPDTRAPYGAFCAFANWQAARLYDASTFTYSDPGLPLTSQTHFSYAQYLFATWLSAIGSISSSKYPNKACTDAVQRLACTQAFPECPQSGVTATSVAYLPPCRLQCEQVRAFCGIQATATLPGSCKYHGIFLYSVQFLSYICCFGGESRKILDCLYSSDLSLLLLSSSSWSPQLLVLPDRKLHNIYTYWIFCAIF